MNKIFIDPPSPAYYQNRLFDIADPNLNRDDSLAPFVRLREVLRAQDVTLETADLLPAQLNGREIYDYYSLGVVNNYSKLAERKDVRLRAFVIFEPPVVEPRLYQMLPKLTADFEQVYIHNICGDGYSLKGVDTRKLRQFYWPQPREDVIPGFWERRGRSRRIVVINGNHVPQPVSNELYSVRIAAMAALASTGYIDLYGRGWRKWLSRASMWWPYLKNRSSLMSIYQGTCDSKYEVLSRYEFCLCFENMAMKGYVTEKIFDCFYAGTIPLYLGAPNIESLIPESAYVDCRNFRSWIELLEFVQNLSDLEIVSMRKAGRDFVQSPQCDRYREMMMSIFRQAPEA
jgi:hypothetical protein